MKQKPHRRTRPRPMDLRTAAQRQRIAQLLLCGWSATKIATRLGRTTRAVRYAISTPEFKEVFDQYQRDYFSAIDRQIKHLLGDTVTALRRQLRHPDWRARDAAIQTVLRLHGRVIEKLDLSGSVTRSGSIVHQGQLLPPADDLTPRQRDLMRELLQTYREGHPKQLPPRIIERGQASDE